MTVKKLKEIIKDLPDDAPVLLSGSDHSYYKAQCIVTFAAALVQGRHGRNTDYFEYFGDEHLDKGETKVPVCAIV